MCNNKSTYFEIGSNLFQNENEYFVHNLKNLIKNLLFISFTISVVYSLVLPIEYSRKMLFGCSLHMSSFSKIL